QAAAALIFQDADDFNDLASPGSEDDEADGMASASESFSPLNAPVSTPGRKDAAARQVLEGFARRAYRRPATNQELTDLIEISDLADRAGSSFDESLKMALQAVLASPHFLYRIEAPAD